jgi:PIN domain nuclease of toxin-antitoxin system
MKILLDTQVLIWTAVGSDRVRSAHGLLQDPTVVVTFSVVSLWEIAIKRALDRTEFQIDPATIRNACLAAGLEELPILARHAIAVTDLVPIHRDPFDRLLVAQAVTDELTLLTADRTLKKYPASVRLL